MRTIELRSDTFTLPDQAMREAMATAEVGDDVFGEDPTVNRLQEVAADITGCQGALLVPSGSMANLISLLVHCARGEEFYLGDNSHIFCYEAGSSAAVGGLHPHILPNNEDGTIDPEKIIAAQRPRDSHFPVSRLLCLENTHNRCWGSPLSLEYLDRVRDLAADLGLTLHLDGARIFNAAAALDVDLKELTRGFDSISFCLSKGLTAPVGSLVCGSRDFISRAHRMRKLLGGGMRQAGILAAAGLHALEHRTEQPARDHVLARKLAAGIENIDGLTTRPELVRSNIVYFWPGEGGVRPQQLIEACAARGLLFLSEGNGRLRLVTHFDVDEGDIDTALDILATVTASLG
jgi:threonine aldolase